MARVLKYAMLLAIITLLGFKYYRFTYKDSTAIDTMAAHLAAVKSLLHTNSSIGFYTNEVSDSAQNLYNHVLFVLCPVIVQRAKADTVLLIIDKKLPARDIKNCETLTRNEDRNFIYSLIKKSK